jgi:uroporphyrinogen-III synthase
MRILVTRPEADAKALTAHLVAAGHDVFVEPLLEVTHEDCDEIDIDDAQCLVATSRNAVRALAESPDVERARSLPLYVVGPGTAGIARALGFMNVVHGSGNAAGLLDLLAERVEVNGGPVVCLTGNHMAYDLPGELRRLGFIVLQPVVYRTSAARVFSTPLLARLRAREIDAVLLLSPRTARTYAHLVQSHNILEVADEVCHICLSESVARQLAPLSCRRIVVARQPNLRELLGLLGPDGTTFA